MPALPVAALVALVVLAALAVLAPPAIAAPDMLVGIEQNGTMDQPAQRIENLDRMRALDAQVIRYVLRFDQVAKCDPEGKTVSASNPANPCYDWSVPDAVARNATRRNIQVLFSIVGVPQWVHGNPKYGYVGRSRGQYDRFLNRFGSFTTAAARHYDGSSVRKGAPRVNYWTIWNEPNSNYFFDPQRIRNNRVAPARYARLYAVAARRLKAVDRTFFVAAGPLSSSSSSIHPGTFLAKSLPLLRASKAPVDAFAMNPYIRNAADPASGARGQQPPSRGKLRYPRIGLGNLDDLTYTLDRNPWSAGLPIWITEFAYETAPDPSGITNEQQAEWLAESKFTAWNNPRVKMFIWYALFDDGAKGTTEGWQAGLFTPFFGCASGQKWCAKPAAAMFRLPLHVSATSARVGTTVHLWGQSRSNPQAARIYMWEGSQWQVFNNAPDVNGTVWVSWPLRTTTWFVTCDATCGPMREVTVAP